MRIVLFCLMIGLAAAGPVSAQQVSLPPAAQKSLDAQLVKALSGARAETLRALLEKGADPNTLIPGRGGALHEAAAAGRIDLVRALLDHGANAIMRDTEGRTPRDLALKGGFAQVAATLQKAEDGEYPVLQQKIVAPPSKYVSPTAPKKASKPLSAAEKQMRAYKKLQDYNYVKQNFGRW